MKDSNLLNKLLKKSGEYHPLYGNKLASHLPMGLFALNRLGASDEKLEDFFDEYKNKLEYLGELDKPTTIDRISQYLGDSSQYKNYLQYFIDQIEAHGTKTVLRQSLPVLLPGIAASAFHALIRLAYAIEADNDDEVAISLAYWSAEFQNFELNDKITNDTLEEIIEKYAPVGANHTFSPGIIVDRMAEIGEVLRQNNYSFQPQEISLGDIKKVCLKAFYAKGNFTLLHTVTACHAFTIIVPYIENTEVALRELWKALLVAYLSTGLNYDAVDLGSEKHDIDFNPVIKAALQSSNPHVIKLVYTCFNEFSNNNDLLYYKIAERAASNNRK